MNIVNKVTLRHLKENKRRTLVTIIGVIISVAMLTAVATLAASFMALLQKQEIANGGEWHVLYKDVNEEQLASIQEDKNTKELILSRDVGYSYLEESENDYKPYLFLREYNAAGFEKFPIDLIKGKMPTNESELLISEHIRTNGKVDYEIGDTITLAIGERTVPKNDEYLDQMRPLRTTDGNENVEILAGLETKDFIIVGEIKRPTWEPMSAPGYTVLTYLPEDNFAASETINASVTWEKINRTAVKDAGQLRETLGVEEIAFNNSLLRYYGVIHNESLRTTFISLAAIIMGVIVVGSVSLIYNAFAISVSERSRHLGMLSSIGATKKQKRNSVFFEGAVIGLISIPLGIISGLAGMGITFYFINPIIQDISGISESLTVTVTPLSIVAACVVSMLTIFISTYIPAKRASKVSAIDAIRQTMDVKMTSKEVKTSRIVRKIFGIEAEFGLKNLKRNKRRYSAIVFSLVVSIVLFLTVNFFTDQIKETSGYMRSDINYDIEISSRMNENPFSDTFISSIASLDGVTDQSLLQKVNIDTTLEESQVPDELKQYMIDEKYEANIALHVLDEESLQVYADEIGVNYAQLTEEGEMTAIVLETAVSTGEKRGEATAIYIDPGESLAVTYDDWREENKIALGEIEVIALTDKRPLGVGMEYQGSLTMIVSAETFAELNKTNQISDFWYSMYLTSPDPLAIHDELEELKESNMHVYNYQKIRQEDEQFFLLISVFTYGFIALITAISVANIFNTISTSISLRKREFGMLKSVGMTPKGFNKMINYESIFYGIKSLLYGLPLSIGVMYLIYNAMLDSFDYPFKLPWLSILIVIIGVFIIVGSAMLYSSSKVKKENIIDALKQENI